MISRINYGPVLENIVHNYALTNETNYYPFTLPSSITVSSATLPRSSFTVFPHPLEIKLPKGSKDRIKVHAEKQGESVTGFISRAIDEAIEHDDAHIKQ